jgi:hypothetical protein
LINNDKVLASSLLAAFITVAGMSSSPALALLSSDVNTLTISDGSVGRRTSELGSGIGRNDWKLEQLGGSWLSRTLAIVVKYSLN